jgi:hypothetical protein
LNENPGKIKFQRPKKRSLDAASSADQNSVTSAISKRVLPEAVVGRESGFKSSSSKKKLSKVSSRGDPLPAESEAKKVDKKTKKPNTLSHLMYDDEEEC